MGYSPILSGNNDPNNNGDLHEGFEFGWELFDSSSDHSTTGKPDGIMAGGNVWPQEVPEFREAALNY